MEGEFVSLCDKCIHIHNGGEISKPDMVKTTRLFIDFSLRFYIQYWLLKYLKIYTGEDVSDYDDDDDQYENDTDRALKVMSLELMNLYLKSITSLKFKGVLDHAIENLYSFKTIEDQKQFICTLCQSTTDIII